MFDFLPSFSEALPDFFEVSNIVQDLIVTAAGFWAAGLMMGVVRKALGMQRTKAEDRE